MNFRLFHLQFDPKVEERRTAYNLVVDAIQGNRRTDATLDTIKNLAQQKYPPAMYLYAKLLEAGERLSQGSGSGVSDYERSGREKLRGGSVRNRKDDPVRAAHGKRSGKRI